MPYKIKLLVVDSVEKLGVFYFSSPCKSSFTFNFFHQKKNEKKWNSFEEEEKKIWELILYSNRSDALFPPKMEKYFNTFVN